MGCAACGGESLTKTIDPPLSDATTYPQSDADKDEISERVQGINNVIPTCGFDEKEINKSIGFCSQLADTTSDDICKMKAQQVTAGIMFKEDDGDTGDSLETVSVSEMMSVDGDVETRMMGAPLVREIGLTEETLDSSHPALMFNDSTECSPVSITPDADLSKYTKMRKIGVTRQSVCVRMQRDGFGQQAIDQFFGSTTSVRPEPRLPTGLAPKPKVIPGAKMRQFQWTKMNPFNIEKSIWSECDEEKIDFDPKSLEAVFREKQITTKTTPRKKKIVFDHKIHILEAKRSYNVEIFLSQLKMDAHVVRDIILKMDEKLCTAEQAEKWKKFMPTPEEAAMFQEVQSGDVCKLAKPELFFFTLKNIDRNLPQRLELWEFKMNFDKIIKTEWKRLRALQSARKCLQESQSLRVILSTILALGNHMNGGTTRGQAHGFQICSLSQLTCCRSTNNEMTFMEYLYLYLEKKQPAVLCFPEEWSVLDEAVHVDIATLRRNVAQIGYKITTISIRINTQTIETNHSGHPHDRFSAVMQPFQVLASRQFADLRKGHTKIMQDLSALALFLGEIDDSTAEFLKTLNKFRTDFIKTTKQYAEKRQIAEKRRKSILWKAKRQRKVFSANDVDVLRRCSVGSPPTVARVNSAPTAGRASVAAVLESDGLNRSLTMIKMNLLKPIEAMNRK